MNQPLPPIEIRPRTRQLVPSKPTANRRPTTSQPTVSRRPFLSSKAFTRWSIVAACWIFIVNTCWSWFAWLQFWTAARTSKTPLEADALRTFFDAIGR